MRGFTFDVVFICLLQLLLLLKPSDGSLIPFKERLAFGGLSDLWSDRFPDPFRVLEQIPLGLERDESVPLALARVDWKETPEGHMIILDVPGLKEEDLKIEVEDNGVLRVSGERKREKEKKGDHWHCVERSYGKFLRQFRLPENVDLDSVKAKLENGVLIVSVAQKPQDKIKAPKVVNIAVGDDQPHAKPIGSTNQEAKQEL